MLLLSGPTVTTTEIEIYYKIAAKCKYFKSC